MRFRLPLLVSAGATLACAVAPQIASASHPQYDRDLTIRATPDHIVAGDPVLIYGRFEGRDRADQEITLYHRISENGPFTVIGHTRTDSAGEYAFTRAQDVVDTNRSWYVEGPGRSHSRTIHERVAAEVTLSASTATATTRHPLTFSGQVKPGHRGSRIELQVQRGTANAWQTVAQGRVGSNSDYAIRHGWRTAGAREVRAYFPGDVRNTPAASDPTSVVVNQRQVPAFSISSPAPIVIEGQSMSISGVLDEPHTTTPEPGAQIGLYERAPLGGPFALVQTTLSAAAGGYGFTVSDVNNELYQARTMTAPVRSSAVLFSGVQDAVSMTPSATISTVNATVTFSGSVAPDKAGDVVYLERLGRDGHWQVAATTTVSASSTFGFNWTFGAAGTKQFRARVLSDSANIGGVSTPVTISVSEPQLSALPAD